MNLVAVLVIAVGIVIVIGICVIGICCWRRNRDDSKKPVYTMKDNYSVLASEIRFDNKNKQWFGGSGEIRKIEEQQQKRLKNEYEKYNQSKKSAANFCRSALHKRQIRDSLPCINSRSDIKFCYPVIDEKLQKIVPSQSIIMTQFKIEELPILNDKILGKDKADGELGKYRCIDFNNDKHFTAFKLALESLEHEYILPILDIGLSKDKKHLFIFREFNNEGSLRDHIYNTDLSKPYGVKYERIGKHLDIRLVRRYGRQILEGMNYLSSCGLVNYHLHTGNIIIEKLSSNSMEGTPKISEIENNFLSLPVKHPYNKYLKKLKKIYPDLNVELCLFGYLLFEMATGRESPVSSPLDCLHELPFKLPNTFVNVLGKIFGDRSLGVATRISDLLNSPFFSAKNVPPLNISSFLNIRKENIILEQIITCVNMQSFRTYSSDSKNVLKQYNKPKSIKKKRKKKKKRRSNNSNNTSSTKSPISKDDSDFTSPTTANDDSDDDSDNKIGIQIVKETPKELITEALKSNKKNEFEKVKDTSDNENENESSDDIDKLLKSQPKSKYDSSSDDDNDEEAYFP